MARYLAFLLAGLLSAASSFGAEPKPFPGKPSKWQGFDRHDFKVGDLDAIVVTPALPLPGRPWVWRGEFFGAFADADAALVKAGWHLAYLKAPDCSATYIHLLPMTWQKINRLPKNTRVR